MESTKGIVAGSRCKNGLSVVAVDEHKVHERTWTPLALTDGTVVGRPPLCEMNMTLETLCILIPKKAVTVKMSADVPMNLCTN